MPALAMVDGMNIKTLFILAFSFATMQAYKFSITEAPNNYTKFKKAWLYTANESTNLLGQRKCKDAFLEKQSNPWKDSVTVNDGKSECSWKPEVRIQVPSEGSGYRSFVLGDEPLFGDVNVSIHQANITVEIKQPGSPTKVLRFGHDGSPE